MATSAPLVFEGTVRALREATMPQVEPDELTAVVTVDRIIRAPDAMKGLTGRTITVQLRQPTEVGVSVVFAAEGWLYGDSMAVVEVGDRGATEVAAVGEDEAARWSSRLTERAQESDTVVVGRVAELHPLARAEAYGEEESRSEHWPDWWVASIEVEQVLKGSKGRGGTVEVLFANSQDVMWRHAPKLLPDQHGVFMLHRGDPRVADRRAFAVLEDTDVQAVDAAESLTDLS